MKPKSLACWRTPSLVARDRLFSIHGSASRTPGHLLPAPYTPRIQEIMMPTRAGAATPREARSEPYRQITTATAEGAIASIAFSRHPA